MMTQATTNKFSPKMSERRVRMVQQHIGDYPTHRVAVALAKAPGRLGFDPLEGQRRA